MGNIVGSLEIPKILRARRNLFLEMTDRQREILIGCMLGDAYIHPLGKIRIEQSIKQRDYVQWKYQELKSLAYPSLPRGVIHRNLKANREYQSLFFSTRQYFRPWRVVFYQKGKKIFPNDLLLTPLSLAVWYMDDGCWTGKKCVISTESFNEGDSNNIQNTLLNQLGIESVVGKNGKLTVRKKSHDKFYSLVSPYIISSMKYKIPNPVTTSIC